MKLNLCLIVAAYLVIDLCWWHGPLDRALTHYFADERGVVARVHGVTITETPLMHAVQEDLFRRGQDWNQLSEADRAAVRQRVLDRLIDGLVVRAARLDDHASVAPGKDSNEELQVFIKQFPLDTDYTERLPLQHLNEAQLQSGMQAVLDDQAWLEKQIPAINEAEVRAWYEAHASELNVPESFHAAHMFLADHEKNPKDDPNREPEIRAFYDQLTSHSITLEALAAKASDDERSKKASGDLGWFTNARMPADFMAAVKALKPGELSPPVHTHLGWHIIKLIDKKPARVPKFEEVREEIAASLQNRQRVKIVREVIAGLRAKYVKQ